MSRQVVHSHYGSGIGLGTILAVLLSWSVNHSILWVIIHGIFGWFYVLYHVCKFYL
jgi:p-aminobenzoyl-glutamate transporter AbgT